MEDEPEISYSIGVALTAEEASAVCELLEWLGADREERWLVRRLRAEMLPMIVEPSDDAERLVRRGCAKIVAAIQARFGMRGGPRRLEGS